MLELITSYPLLLTTVAVLGVCIILMVFKVRRAEPKTTLPIPHTSNGEGSVFMTLKSIQLFPDNPELAVQVIAYINGMEFHYPSADKDKWISMVDNLQDATIELPNAELYRIHLAVHLRSGETLEGGPAVVRRALLEPRRTAAESTSQALGPAHPHHHADYKLYLVEDGRRDMELRGIIPYVFYIA